MDNAVNQINATESTGPCRPGMITIAIFIAIIIVDLIKKDYAFIPGHAIFGIVCSLLMYTLCSVNMGIVAWVLLVLPFFLIAFGYLVYSIRRREKTEAAKQQLLSTESKPAPYPCKEPSFYY